MGLAVWEEYKLRNILVSISMNQQSDIEAKLNNKNGQTLMSHVTNKDL